METEIQKMHQVWGKYQMAKKRTDLPLIKFDDLINSIFTVGPTYYYIIDFFDMKISHMSASVKDIHGVNPETVTFDDILKLIHPDDMEHVSRAESTILHMVTSKIKWDNVTKYKMSYSFRFLTADHVYKLFLHQALTLTTDEKGRVGKSLNIHTDISQIATENNYKVSLIGLMGEPSYLDIDPSNLAQLGAEDYTTFSKREVQIIKLIGKGETTLGISVKLNIAQNTAKNHRRNILKKAGVKNTAELIRLCMQKGLV